MIKIIIIFVVNMIIIMCTQTLGSVRHCPHEVNESQFLEQGVHGNGATCKEWKWMI